MHGNRVSPGAPHQKPENGTTVLLLVLVSVQEQANGLPLRFVSFPHFNHFLTPHLSFKMSSPLPTAKVIHVETRGAVILDEASPQVRALSA
jgi:hypothetical protein